MFKIGYSQDIHNLIKGDGFILGGIKINADFGVSAFSDGDVLLHAIGESILGALGLDDLGAYFNSQNCKENFSSMDIIDFVIGELKKEKYIISNIDTQIILDRKNLRDYKNNIKQNICRIFGIENNQVSIKATTSEEKNLDQICAISNILIRREN